MHCETFSTQDVPAARRARSFQEAMNRLFALGLQVNPGEEEPFTMSMRAYASPLLRMAAFRFSAHETMPRIRPQGRESYFLLALQREGRTRVAQDGRESVIEAGDLFLVDTGRPFSFRSSAIVTQSLYLPAHQVREVFAIADALSAVRIGGDTSAGMLLKGMIGELFALAPGLDGPTEERLSTAAPHVLAVALSSLAGHASTIPPRLERYHKDRIRRFIRANLENPDLDVTMIAQGVNLSLRRIYGLFANEPVSVTRSIWLERLERCRIDMASPALRGHRIGDIAARWGFRDLAHFSRAFRGRYGMTPSAFRCGAQLRGPPAGA